MIDRIIDGALRARAPVLALAALLLVVGTWITARMPVDVFPDLTAPAVTVVTESSGLSPLEVEQLVTFPIEASLNGAAGVRRVRSLSSIGLSVVTVEFDWGVNLLEARQTVNERLQLVRSNLPPDVDPPQMAPAASVMGEILFAALVSDRHDGMELNAVANTRIKRRLLGVPGVAEVMAIGGEHKQYQVTLDPTRLLAHRIGIEEVLRALRESSQNVPAGFYTEQGREFVIQGLARLRDTDDVGAVAVAERGGRPVFVRELGTVALGAGPTRGLGAHNGRPAVVLAIQKQPGANTLALTRELDDAFARLQAELPEGMQLETRVFRQADFIERAVSNLVAALRDGSLLIVLIVFAFLASVRATLVTLVALPLSVLAAILVLKVSGSTLNTMTLGGLAIALGVLVDDAIIVVENVVRRLRENAQVAQGARAPIDVVRRATHEVQGSIVFATFVIALVFLPIFVLTGVEGRLLAPLATSYLVALLASLVVAITVTPVLCYVTLRNDRRILTHEPPAWVRSIQRTYARQLELLLPRGRLVALASAAALLAAVIGVIFAGRAFLPDFNEGSLTVNVVTVPGTSLPASDEVARRVEDIMLAHPEVVQTARRTGRSPGDPHAQEVYASEIEASLSMGERSKEDLLASLRREFATLPGTSVTVGQPISHRIDHLLSGTRSAIAVKVFGPDLYELRRLGKQVQGLVQEVRGAVDVSLEAQADVPYLTLRLRREALADYGLTVAQASEAIQTAFAGTPVGLIQEQEAAFDLVVRLDPAVKSDTDALAAARFVTPAGAEVPLSAIADVRRDRGPNMVGREGVERRIVVSANVADRDLQGVVEDIRASIASGVAMPQGYRFELGGQFESAQSASRALLFVGVIVLFGVYGLLYLAFRSARDAALIMLNLPLALIGGVAGMYLAGGTMSVATLVGFITLFGIATRNGVMLVSHIRYLAAEMGRADMRAVVVRAARERLVPILMTALAAALGLVPLAMAAGAPGSEIQAPMAIVILAGLVTSTILNMAVVPLAYLRFGELMQDEAWQPGTGAAGDAAVVTG
jgi:CzcA family heavy metal efflux pump